jgi:hypothetical protein
MGKYEFFPQTKFSEMAPIISRPSVWNFLQVTLLAARILKWLVDFLEIFLAQINKGRLEDVIIVAQVTGIISLQNLKLE